MDESELIKKCKNGDMEAYGKLVEKHMKKAYNTALYFTKDPNDAWDVSQESFIRAWRGIKKFKEEKPFFPWLYTIIKNEAYRKFRREKNLINKKEVPMEVVSSPEDILINMEKIEELRHSLARIDEDKREIIYLRHYADMSYREISLALNIPEGTVMSRLYYARKQLLEEFKNEQET